MHAHTLMLLLSIPFHHVVMVITAFSVSRRSVMYCLFPTMRDSEKREERRGAAWGLVYEYSMVKHSLRVQTREPQTQMCLQLVKHTHSHTHTHTYTHTHTNTFLCFAVQLYFWTGQGVFGLTKWHRNNNNNKNLDQVCFDTLADRNQGKFLYG